MGTEKGEDAVLGILTSIFSFAKCHIFFLDTLEVSVLFLHLHIFYLVSVVSTNHTRNTVVLPHLE